MVKTKRLNLSTATDEEMQKLILEETVEEMKQAYTEMLEGCQVHPFQRMWYAVWFMKLADGSDEIIGDLCFKVITNDGVVEIGYGIQPLYERKGYTTEALNTLVHWAVSQPSVTRFEAETEPENIASQKVLANVGFVPNGEIGQEGPRFTWEVG